MNQHRRAGVKLDFPEHARLPSVPDADESDTLRGVGGRECPTRYECQLAFLTALEARDKRWEQRFEGMEGSVREARAQVAEVRTILLQWLGSKGIRNSDSTPAGQRDGLDISAGPVKVRGRTWVIAAVLLLLGAMGAGSYVLAAWGRPTTTINQPRAK